MPPSAFRPMMPGWDQAADALLETQQNEPPEPLEYTPLREVETGMLQ